MRGCESRLRLSKKLQSSGTEHLPAGRQGHAGVQIPSVPQTLMGKEDEPGKLEEISKKLRNVEVAGAGILALFGQFGWAGVLALGAAVDHGIAKILEWWRKRRKK